ncbi:molecular chaperone HtpG [Megasphaera hominis]|jgi:molecular chaperone HtpG|uniref:Chaperone protein HtpG n=1 Tax=Megasphaera hominis TaxID=159836 RepID=A0ABR6VH49_9FIRM|nr:molecular chaperone HtpG [Megasphaera hominis]MBC3535959.1 molecular chaperone HtpG [Megasphaera hominis]
MAKETFEFQAETKQLLDLMVHSIYTNHEIFLRELISNASDAIDKLHYESLTNRDLLEGDTGFEIHITPDADAHTLTISDNGLGMNRDDLIQNLGTIAKSGTKAFLEKLKEAQEANSEVTDKDMIGQFGVGFYSAFMVADSVTVVTRKAGESQAYKWESTGDGQYTLDECEKPKHGTSIILHLGSDFYGNDKEENYTDRDKISGLVKQYSDYIRYPITMDYTVKEKPKDADGKVIEDAPEEEHVETRTLNSMQPLWTRNKSDIKPEEYKEFFQHQFFEWEDPMEIFHTKAEGAVEYTALLFIPGRAPFNLYYTDYEAGLQLYSRHVFIMDKCKDLLPDYLRFVKGLVDSPDLSLNISRELLQQSRELKLIGRNLEKNILKTLARDLDKDREKYEKFWAEYGKSLKIGIYSGMMTGENNVDKLKDLLLFMSSKDGKLCTLKEYVGRMKEGQQKIYFATGKDRAAIDAMPQMELLRDRDLEVLYMLDPVDEFAVQAIGEYEGKKFHSVSQGDLDLDDDEYKEEKKKAEDLAKDNEGLLKDIKDYLGDKVADVRLSNRLKSGAVCLVADAAGPSIAMEQAFAVADNPLLKARRILEINPHHDLFNRLQTLHEGGKDSQGFQDYCQLLYDQALLLEGILPDDPAAFAQKVAQMMAR